MPIQILDQNTINKIAAGEVIERPASVVKELAENAIDAMATAVTIEIKDGGISFIRITDNGCGIDKGEIPMAFLRHSTSKIKSVEDLMCVRSLGFRGEALSSIAAVAQIELITKTKEAFTGVRYVIEGGKEQNMEDIGAPDGTTFIVRNLFYNTPVRRKFLKTATTEAGYVSALVEHLAFSHPEVSFRFINNGQNKLYTSGNGSLKDIIYHVNGRDIATNLLEVSAKTQDIQISGFIGKPMISRGNRTYENYFINGRYIKSNIITRAIEEGYKGYIMQHQYPFTALHFTIEQSIIDVNVHPTKMELRFSQNEFVYDFVLNAIRNTLSGRELVPEVRLSRSENVTVNKTRPAEPFEVKRMAAEAAKDKKNSTAGLNAAPAATGHTLRQAYVPDSGRAEQLKEDVAVYKKAESVEPAAARTPAAVPKPASAPASEAKPEPVSAPAARPPETPVPETLQKSASPAPEQLSLITPDDTAAIPKPVLVGQVFDTYWIIQFEDKMFIMDQHAAHEKILYERTMRRLENGNMDTQMIAPPVILSLNMREKEVLSQNIDIFTRLGFEIESFGGNEYKVTGMPATLPSLDDHELLMDIIDSLMEEGGASSKPELITQRVASMSCKAAVKGNMRMSFAEAQNLVEELMNADNPYNCPHGRPTLISMSKYELEKKFKRIV